MATRRVNPISVVATFDASTETLAFTTNSSPCPNLPPGAICVPPGLSRITITLATVNGTEVATFADPAVLWTGLASGQAEQPPAAFSARGLTSIELALWDLNEAKQQFVQPFTLVIRYGTAFYYSDPSIVNQPPG
jgi:hypothetical protein